MLKRLFPAAAAAFLLQVTTGLACSVPVFRYALEQWQADNLAIVVFHRGELTPGQQALVDRIEPKGLDEKYVANTWIKTVDLDQAQDKDTLALWETQSARAQETLPWMVVLPPAKALSPNPVLSDAFTAASLDSLLDSPARTEMTKRLIKGDSVVWILLEGGTQGVDDAAAEILDTELKRLETVIEPPEIDPKDVADGSLSIDPKDLKIRFSMIRLSRDDPQERSFIQMLLATEPDLRDEEFSGQPMALPVFGRARSLYALIGKGINAETIEDASRFLTGACQCTIKAQNPGVDLLTSMDWDQNIDVVFKPDTSIPTLVGLGGFAAGTEESDASDSTSRETSPETSHEVSESAAASVDVAAALPAARSSSGTVANTIFILFGVLAIAVVGISITVGRG